MPIFVARNSDGLTYLSDSPEWFSTLTSTVARPLVFVVEHVARIRSLTCAFNGALRPALVHNAAITRLTARRILIIPLENPCAVLALPN